MITTKQFTGQETISGRLRHPCAIYGKHIGMHPVFCRLVMTAGFRLGNFIGMMGSGQIKSTAMNVEFAAEVFCTHGRTFDMPAGEALAPW
ncbi:hypothetical protein D9M68_817450 [compost metagenome]